MEEALWLYRAFQDVREPQDFEGLVAACRELSRRLEAGAR